MMTGIAIIRSRRGLLSKIAREIGITLPSISVWQEVPLKRVVDVERASGIPRHLLRPDAHLPPAGQISFVVDDRYANTTIPTKRKRPSK